MAHIVCDESGTLRSSVLYKFEVPFMGVGLEEENTNAIVSPPKIPDKSSRISAGSEMWVAMPGANSADVDDLQATRCSTDPSHIQQALYKELDAELFGGEALWNDFLQVDHQRCKVITARLRELLMGSGLVGMDTVPLETRVHVSGLKHTEFSILRCRGNNCIRPFRVQNAVNKCPFCDYQPLVCQECGYMPIFCPDCGHQPTISEIAHGGEHDLRLTRWTPCAIKEWILDGRRWDGSDFVRCGFMDFISRRAALWLISVGAAPFIARPARICVDGMSDEQLAQCDTVAQPGK
jgi:hypothetical protein